MWEVNHKQPDYQALWIDVFKSVHQWLREDDFPSSRAIMKWALKEPVVSPEDENPEEAAARYAKVAALHADAAVREFKSRVGYVGENKNASTKD